MDIFTLTPEMTAFFRASAWRAADELRLFERADLSRRERILISALKLDGGARPEVPVVDQGWGRLVEVLRQDRPLPLPASSPWPEYHAYLAAAGREPARKLAPRLVAEGGALLDLGGALGTYARAFVEAGGARAVVVDRQEVPPQPIPGVEFVKADLFDYEGGGFDVVLLCNVLHLHGAEECARLCARARRMGRAVVVKDFDPRTAAGAWFSLNMALYTENGQVHEAADIVGWLGGGTVDKMGDHLVIRGA
jgi:hypothetical protein